MNIALRFTTKFLARLSCLWFGLSAIAVVSQENVASNISLQGASKGDEWNINCNQLVVDAKHTIEIRTDLTTDELTAPKFLALQEKLTVCTKLFNSPENPLYKACPNFALFETLLAELGSQKDEAWWQVQMQQSDFALECLD